MNILSEITKMTTINIDSLVDRLKDDLNVKNKNINKLYYAIYDVFNIILGITHQNKISNQMYTISYRMILDYWYMNGYDKMLKEKELNSKSSNNTQNQLEIKSIKIGDTTTTFEDNSSKIEINGIKHNTATIDICQNIITEKYKKELYGFRKMRW